jgi:predicted  nucleic acid-binding Zn-ribbon protein
MSEANVPPRHEPSSQSGAVPSTPAADTAQDQAWTAVPLPGTLPTEPAMPSAAPTAAPREAELLTLIRDLNRCNEALMARVNQLENALDQSQQALKVEVGRSRQRQASTDDKAAVAQQRSMAQLLSELETASDGLKRQRILNETLQAQLDTSQERVTQLDRECTVLRQRHSEQGQALEASEILCRDLRSRLQRQQRYTLQFKAALEKCLDMNAQAGNAAIPHQNVVMDSPYSSFEDTGSNPLSMPRAERIQPWSSAEGDTVPGAMDPQLMALLKRPQTSSAEASVSPTNPSPSMATSADPPSDGDADTRLWQDLERVVDHSTPSPASPTPDPTAPAAPSSSHSATFTEPLPWGPPQKRAADTEPAVTAHGPVDVDEDTPETAADTANPPPWPPATESPSIETETPHRAPDPLQPVADPERLPVFNITGTQSPSPLVHPLKPQKKKRTSLSAVELPSFPPLPKTSGGH